MSLCADNQTLTDIKDKQKELNNILEAGKEQLAAMQSKMNELKGKLESFKPEIPEIGGIQKDLLSLTSVTTPEQLTSKLTELNSKYGILKKYFFSYIICWIKAMRFKFHKYT